MNLLRSLAVLSLFFGISACKATTLDPDTKVAPEFQTYHIFDVPAYVGTKATPFDGTWEGLGIMDFDGQCTYNVDTVFQVIFEIKNGVFKRIRGHYDYYANLDAGYVNNVGTFMVVSSGAENADESWSGTISGDRMRGTWREWSYGCSGRIELARIAGNRFYCLDRLDNSTYVHTASCRQMDRTLTKAEFDAVRALPAEKIKGINTPVSAQITIEQHLADLMRLGR